VSATALIALLGIGIAATAGRPAFGAYLVLADAALLMLASVLVLKLVIGAHPGIAERARLGRTGLRRLVSPTASALIGRAIWHSLALLGADLFLDLLSINLMFSPCGTSRLGAVRRRLRGSEIAGALPLTPAAWESSKSRWPP
jgi:hypothetical protein